MEAAIGGDQLRRTPVHRLVMRHGRLQFVPLDLPRSQDPIARHDATVHLVKDDLPPKFDGGPSLVATQDARMWLKQTDELFLRWDWLTKQHPLARLMDHARHERHKAVEL